MKRATIGHMRLVNFKGIRELTVEFDNVKRIEVLGANGTGKTTIYDAFLWVLFGKDSAGRKEFEIKTLDAVGNVIPRLPHEVSLTLCCEGDNTTFRKRLTEKWTRKRGAAEETFSGNTTECFIDDVPYSVADYNAAIRELFDEESFRAVTNVRHFISMKPEAQRTALFNMAGGINTASIIEQRPELREVMEMLGGKSAADFRKDLAAKMRRLKEEAQAIPVRIDELLRMMPAPRDWKTLEQQLRSVEQQQNAVEKRLADRSRAEEAREAELAGLACQEREAQSALMEARRAVEQRINAKHYEAKAAHDALKREDAEMYRQCEELDDAIDTTAMCLTSEMALRESLISEWRAIRLRAYTPVADAVCPTCGQQLPQADIDAQNEQMRQRYDAETERLLAENERRGKAQSEKIKGRTEVLEAAKRELSEVQLKRAAIADSLNAEIPALLEGAELEAAIAADPCVAKAQRTLAGVKAAIAAAIAKEAKPTDDYERLKALAAERHAIEKLMEDRQRIQRSEARIAELQSQLRAIGDEMARLEGMEYSVLQLRKAQVQQMEDRVNALFSLVRWKLFDNQINGGEVEVCIATVGGVPYSDINSAARINAGLDIINAVSRYCGMLMPIFIDNRETCSEPMRTDAQEIHLIVSPEHKELTINTYSDEH